MALPLVAIALSAGFLTTAARTIFNTIFVVITYAGLQTLLSQVENYLQSNLSGLPSDFAGLAGLIGLDTGLSIVLSAFAVRMAMAALSRIRAK